MELEVGSCAWPVVDQGSVGVRAAAGRVRWMAPSDTSSDVTACRAGLRHTTPETWATTSTRMPVVTKELGDHEVSKPSMTDARRRAERIGPTVMAAPYRGQAHVVAVPVVVVGAVASVDRW